MNIIKDFNFRNKLVLVLLALLLPLSYFAITAWTNEQGKVTELKNKTIKLQETERVAEVLSRIQRERAFSYVYFLTEGHSSSAIEELQRQRALTDESIEMLHAFYEFNNLNNILSDTYASLNAYRQDVDLFKTDSNILESYYGNIVNSFADRLETIANSMEESVVRGQFNAYIHFLKMKFEFSQIRTALMRIIDTTELTNADLVFISGRKSLMDAAEEDFIENASAQISEFYKERTNNETTQEINELINNILLQGESISQEDAIYWFDTFTAHLDALREVDNYIIDYLGNYIANRQNEANRQLTVYAILFGLSLAFSLLLAIYILSSLIKTVKILKSASDKIAKGDTNISLPNISSKDEIGALAQSFKTVVEKNKHLASVARAIGRGDYSVAINIDNEEDLLANSLKKMQESLHKLSERDKKNTWLLIGNSELSDLVSADRSLKSASTKIINHTCQYIGAEIGAFYVMNEQYKLVFEAGYALGDDFKGKTSQLGEQALDNRKIIRLKDIAASEFKIRTSFSESEPAEIIVVPLFAQDQAVGVLELAAREAFTDDKIDYLLRISEKIATTIITIRADIKTAELLSETQTQAEELETQHEELRQVNQELFDQKERLQLSEEELKANQEELEEKNAELEEKAKQLGENNTLINNKNRELEMARQAIQLQLDELQRVSKYRSDFLANMSHELRTPLNSILILAKLISENREKNLTAKQIEFAQVIHNSGNDLLKLINEVLDLTKIEAGKLSLEVMEFDPRELNLKSIFQEFAKEKNILFEVNYGNNLPDTISSDKFRIEQVLKNLLSNAFKFTDEGGEVRLDMFVPKDIRMLKSMTLKEADNVVAFSVTDTGVGISAEDQKVIFDAFKQADSSTTRKYGGTGLGLSICRELAQLLGGELLVESELGKGSCFTLYLPDKIDFVEDVLQEAVSVPDLELEKNQNAVESIIQHAQDPTPTQKEKTLLIIEDDKGFANILADFAKSRKINPVVAHLGKEGLAIMEELRPSAVLLDINLPDISGWDVLDQIKKNKELRDIPVHIMSAYSIDTKKRDLSEDKYLSKPVTLENIDKAFLSILNQNKSTIKKVLIVEDNEVESLAVKELLHAHEINSDIANDGEQALIKLKNGQYDCIILDINMPGIGGYEILDKIKADSKIKKTPVIVYSGKDFTEEEEFRLKKHVNAIVLKTDYSYKRLMDEVKLFLHKVKEHLPELNEGQLYRADESLKNKKVLVVDDDSRNVYALYNAFESEGMEIVIANNGIEALNKLEEHKDVNIVLMDIMMPEMDGLECTRKIREIAHFQHTPIIALTAKAMKEDKEKCLQAGASDYVTKPVNVEKLLSLMRVWIYKNENLSLY